MGVKHELLTYNTRRLFVIHRDITSVGAFSRSIYLRFNVVVVVVVVVVVPLCALILVTACVQPRVCHRRMLSVPIVLAV